MYNIIKILSTIFLLIALLLYGFKNTIIKALFNIKIEEIQQSKNIIIGYDDIKLKGLQTIDITNLAVNKELNDDTLLNIKHLAVSIDLKNIVLGNIKITDIYVKDGKLSFIERYKTKNYDFLVGNKNPKIEDISTAKNKDYSSTAYKLFNRVITKVPTDLDLTNFTVYYKNYSNDKEAVINTEYFKIKNDEIKSSFIINHGETKWSCEGKFDSKKELIDVKLYANEGNIEFPLLYTKFGLKISADTIYASLKEHSYENDEFKINCYFGAKDFIINHPKINKGDVLLNKAYLKANLAIGENYIKVDSSSVISVNDINLNPYIKYTIYPHKVYEFKLKTDWVNAQDFFNSLPKGMFNSVKGIIVSGELKYNFNFKLDEQDIEHCEFNSELLKRNFKIKQFGELDLKKINTSFFYEPVKSKRFIFVDSTNYNYAKLEDISKYLKGAILTAEDHLFYTHKGFIEESFRKSIIDNIKTKRFKRGGSTISMQLVKNVYLTRDKTISRKFEEILLVWLIENNRLTTKDRMLEVYFNIIEWGPDIYGIGEASRFYFNKKTADLTLSEAIFLTSIVPAPSKYKWKFKPDGQLKKGIDSEYYTKISEKMVITGKITQQERDSMQNVVLLGKARKFVITDSTYLNKEDMSDDIDEYNNEFQEYNELLD